MPRLKASFLLFLCLCVFACRVADAAPRDKDLKKAESVVAKLHMLEEASGARDAGAYRKAAKKVYPDIFVAVSSLRDGSIKTDLSTAAALYESAYRNRSSSEDARPDCARELRAKYFQLCRESDSRTRLLMSKAALHTRWAESAIAYERGDRSEATLDALNAIHAERSTDIALAEEALRELKELSAELTGGESPAEARRALDAGSSRSPDAQLTHTLGEVERIIASLPRSRVRQLLGNARDAFRDGLFWQLKAAPARALVVSADSLERPDPLRQINLNSDDATRAALQNLRVALKYIARAEAAIAETRSAV